ncbi:MAG: ABC transporter substrate-binding protein, partial [Elioraea tepidiphila]
SAVALAVQNLSRERRKIDVVVAAGTTDLTGPGCSPYGVHWTYDNYALSRGTVGAVMQGGGRRWFFITSDYAFGHSLEANATAAIAASTVLGLRAEAVAAGLASFTGVKRRFQTIGEVGGVTVIDDYA